MQSLERMQTLFELGAFEVHLVLFDQSAVCRKISFVPEQQGNGFLAVASCSARLLCVVVQAD